MKTMNNNIYMYDRVHEKIVLVFDIFIDNTTKYNDEEEFTVIYAENDKLIETTTIYKYLEELTE